MRFVRYMTPWTLLALLFAIQGYGTDLMAGHTWRFIDYVRWSLVEWYTLAALAPCVFWLTARYPIELPLRVRFFPAHVLASLAFAGAAVLVAALVSHVTEPGHPPVADQIEHFVRKHAITAIVTYWVLVTIRQAERYYREKNRRALEATELKTQLAESRLMALKMQLQPHFLFNTLHAISTLIREDAATAEDMLLRLGELLRVYLHDDRQEVALSRELELLDLYLGIQRIRFGDRLGTRIDAARSALDGAVPALILQPLVENAIHHGIGKHAGSDCVEIAAHRDADHLYLEVRNRTGTLEVSPEEAFARGVGLSNARLRLKELYGNGASIYIDALLSGGVVCRLRLPYRALAIAGSATADIAAA